MSAPLANSAAPVAPTQAAQEQAPAPAIQQAPQAQGAAQPQPAPAARRNRAPRGPVPRTAGTANSGAPALLELAAAIPMATVQRRAANFFVPDANFLFHVLGICDNMMGSTHRFLQSAPAWLPIVSQLYISLLWMYQIMNIYAHTGYGLLFADLLRNLRDILRLDECLVPGPLVPFFESLAAVSGPFDWIGDVTSALPDFHAILDAANWHFGDSYLRSLPFPTLLLDQLHYFATWNPPANQTVYGNFEWFRNIFSVPANAAAPVSINKLGPHAAGSLYCVSAQVDAARTFWNAAFQGQVRLNAGAGQPHMSTFEQILGLTSIAGHGNYNWYQHVAVVMQKYALYFNGSKALKDISPVGVGSVLAHARPRGNTATRDWLYPNALPGAFLSSRFQPSHEIPDRLLLDFQHSDHDIEEIAEQYAVLTSTNIQWARHNAAQHGYNAVQLVHTHDGTYWNMMEHRTVTGVNLKHQYSQLIASRYHHSTALRTE